jgi:CBS domain containing-hemolysin-like protein
MMIWIAVILGLAGVFLSAFFSGSETGFYRATRIRLVLDALEGDWISRALVWLTNQPTLFIATALVGTNLANYLVSMATVIGTEALFGSHGFWAELLVPLIVAPPLFIYGELLPKNLYLHSPNRLLRMSGPLFLGCTVLLLPISILLWGVNEVLSRFISETPEKVQLAIARRELRRLLEEGHETGVLHPAQRLLARGIFTVARQPVTNFLTPLSDVGRARVDMTKEEILGMARRLRLVAVPIESVGTQPRLIGYVRVIDLALNPSPEVAPLRRLVEIPSTDTHLDALMRMHRAKESLAQVIDGAGRTLGLLTAARLRGPLFRGEA